MNGRAFTRGHAPAFLGGRQLLVVNVDPGEVSDALSAMERRAGSANRVLMVPRLSFVTHLRDFWREVRRLTASGAILRFSRFLGKTRQEAILNFLAFLELIKRRRLYARQKELFGDIEFGAAHDTVSREDNTEP
jgi:chromatin segregation and condensation protein Rec8/ScpA/Scc1 (kleisin family)